MSGVYPTAMDIGHVVKERKFDSGGQGTVWAVKDRKINKSWPVAYKEYKPEIRPQVQVDVLAEMVDFIPALEHGTGEWLANCTAWPAMLVKDSAGVCGFLMRQIPGPFLREFAFAPGEKKAAGFEYLLNPADYLKTAGISITPRQRFELLLDFARTLGRLHSLGIAVGDLSPKNMFFSLEGAPRCFLIDCDAMVLRGKSMLPQAETPNWGVPDGEPKGTESGDAYKFGLLATRLFAGQQDGKDLRVLSAADAAAGRLAERSLSADPARRPKPEDWLTVLTSAVSTAPATLPKAPPPASAPRTTSARAQSAAASPAGNRQQTRPKAAPRPAARPTPPRTPQRPRRPAPAPKGKSHAGRWVIAVILLLLALRYGPAVYEEFKENSASSGSGQSGLGSGGSGTSAENSAEGQARALSGLLERNEGNRGSVGEAVRRMMACPGSSGLLEVQGVFEDAASARDSLVQDLAALDVDLLPSAMTENLESGWEASADADRAYAQLAEEVMSGCTSGAVVASAYWDEASRANTRATAAKKDFVSDWNPLADEHGLPTMAWDEV
ncbi:hypothetical protein [Streptomyces sp. NPDC018833]|uniref:hypothetical protein n=1 Tax=Streptomyces sp. NPDC018833 TaxID=3365053 RepID=UPI0037917122